MHLNNESQQTIHPINSLWIILPSNKHQTITCITKTSNRSKPHRISFWSETIPRRTSPLLSCNNNTSTTIHLDSIRSNQPRFTRLHLELFVNGQIRRFLVDSTRIYRSIGITPTVLRSRPSHRLLLRLLLPPEPHVVEHLEILPRSNRRIGKARHRSVQLGHWEGEIEMFTSKVQRVGAASSDMASLLWSPAGGESASSYVGGGWRRKRTRDYYYTCYCLASLSLSSLLLSPRQ